MSQQNAQILFMEIDSQSDQWACKLLKYTRPSPIPSTAIHLRLAPAELEAPYVPLLSVCVWVE